MPICFSMSNLGLLKRGLLKTSRAGEDNRRSEEKRA